jgi:DNA primase
MTTKLEELKAIPILDVAARLGLELRGTSMHCFSHAHEDRKTPSLHFNVRGNYFNCFGCGIGGSTIDLVMACCGCSRKDAMLWLGQKFGLSSRGGPARQLHILYGKRDASSDSQQITQKRKSDPEVYAWLLENAPLPREASDYLIKRGLSAKTIDDFKLGGSLDARNLVRAAEQQFGRNRVFNAGLLTEGKPSGKLWPVWWGPIVLIPFYLEDRAPVYLQARRLTTEDRRKYIGLSGVAKPLFNAQIIHDLEVGSEIYIVEGAMDAMAAREIGLHAIGVLGSTTKFERNWTLALRNFQVIIVPDQDAPGFRFKDNVVAAFSEIGKSVQVRYLPAGYKDLTEAIFAIKEGNL